MNTHKRLFVAANHGMYEYGNTLGIHTLQDALEYMKKNYHVRNPQGEELPFTLEGWEDISCYGCDAKSCLWEIKRDISGLE